MLGGRSSFSGGVNADDGARAGLVVLKLERMGQRPRHLVLIEGDTDAARRRFDRIAELITAEWRRLKARRAASLQKRSRGDINEWLRRTCYDFLRFYIDRELTSFFKERIQRHSRRMKGYGRSATPFQFGLLAIFAKDDSLMPSPDRTRIGRQLWIAYRHYVPAPLLEGFATQRGKVPKVENQDDIMPSFAEWIAECYLDDPFRAAKGGYRLDQRGVIRRHRRDLEAARE